MIPEENRYDLPAEDVLSAVAEVLAISHIEVEHDGRAANDITFRFRSGLRTRRVTVEVRPDGDSSTLVRVTGAPPDLERRLLLGLDDILASREDAAVKLAQAEARSVLWEAFGEAPSAPLGAFISERLVPLISEARRLAGEAGERWRIADSWSTREGIETGGMQYARDRRHEADEAARALGTFTGTLEKIVSNLAARQYAVDEELEQRSRVERIMETGTYGVSVAGDGLDGLLSTFAISYCGWMPGESRDLPKRAANVGAQHLLTGVSLDDAVAAKDAVEEFGYTGGVFESAARVIGEAPRREAIPERVRHEVWRRDQGRCVVCGSQERLEFDHTIPISRGGSNTARNIELRCEYHNRAKGAHI